MFFFKFCVDNIVFFYTYQINLVHREQQQRRDEEQQKTKNEAGRVFNFNRDSDSVEYIHVYI